MTGVIRLLFVCLLTLIDAARADLPPQSLESILSAIRAHIESNFRHPGDHYEIEIAPIDQRLQLAGCDRPLEVFFPQASQRAGNINVGVRCNGEHAWTIYHKAYVRLFKNVAILNNPLAANAIIKVDDVHTEKKDVTPLHGLFLSPEQAIGKPVKKSLPSGTVLNPNHLAAIKLIKKGDKVTIRTLNAGLEVSMAGEAQMDGEMGQSIRVRNEHSNRIVQGIVTGQGIVDITH